MDAKEKTLAAQFRLMQIMTHRYLRQQFHKADETDRENRKEIVNKLFDCLSEEEQKIMRSYLERIVEALKQETKETDDDDEFDFLFYEGYSPHFAGFGHSRHGSHTHGHWR